MKAIVNFCGETYVALPDEPVAIGRTADLSVDENPYLHRRFLQVSVADGLVWLDNLGSRLSATVVDEGSRMHAYLAPGARFPIVFERVYVRFSAGPTSYELSIEVEGAPFTGLHFDEVVDLTTGTETIGHIPLTPEQRLLIVALAEPLLLQDGRGTASIPSSAEVAARLGWSTTKLTRKLDSVCSKLSKVGVRGLHGRPGELASSRRARLVEYALAVRLVTVDDLASLECREIEGAVS